MIYVILINFIADFSPLENSDSSDSGEPHENLFNPSAMEHYERDPTKSPDSTASIKSDSAYSAENFQPTILNNKSNRSSKILQIEEAQLAIQREKLKVLKSIADDLSAIHRGFLKAYKLKWWPFKLLFWRCTCHGFF